MDTNMDTKITDTKNTDANKTDAKQTKTAQSDKSAQVTDEQVINWIKSRRSIGNLNIPAPKPEQIQVAIECAMTAPDHKKLQPWRFTVTQAQARHALSRAFVTAAQEKALREQTKLDDASLQKIAKMPLRAPMIITVATKMQYHEKVPEFEQILSAGAAVQNLILALKAQGYSTVWRTGLLANEAAVKAYFDVDDNDYIVAFVYVGSSACDMPTRESIDIAEFVRFD